MADRRAKRRITSSVNNTNNIITIGEAFKAFEREKRAKGLAESSIKNYSTTIRRLVEECNFRDDTDIKEITKDVIVEWVNSMIKTELRPQSINHFIRDLRAFLNWCMADERKYLPTYKIDSVKAQEALPKAFDDDALKVILRKPKGKEDLDFVEWRAWASALLALDMGARASSLCSILIGDINFNTKTIYLRHTKNKKLAYFNISTECVKALKEYIKLYRNGCADGEYLFCNVAGEALTYNALAKSFREYCRKRGLEQFNLHGLRHSFANEFVKNTNGDMVKLQRALGHSSIDMSRRYVDIANIDMGDYDTISPLITTVRSGKSGGGTCRKVRARKAS